MIPDHVSYGDKVLLLKRIYDANPEAQIPNEILYALLNGSSRFKK